MTNQNYEQKPLACWTKSEQENIVKTLAIIINGQKAFGKDYSVSDTFTYYKLKLDGRFTAAQVLNAMMAYTDKKNDVPAPSDLIEIINPPPVKITQAEYVHACKQHELEGYPMGGYYGGIIKEFQQQESREREKTTAQITAQREAGKLTNDAKLQITQALKGEQ